MRNESFESVRSRLHHDRLKNEFLGAMGFYPAETDMPERYSVMQKALKGDQGCINRLKRGCALWESLSNDIREFLSTLPQKYGYVLTDTYKNEQAKAVTGLNVMDDVISRIQRNIFQEDDIKKFWESVDTVRTLLEEMAKSRRFNEFVKTIDPGLMES